MKEAGIPQKKPIALEMAAGEYWWCSCGYSKTQPFCDGSHSTSDTGLQPMKVVLDKPTKVWWCACKRSGTKPHCDGTHKNIK